MSLIENILKTEKADDGAYLTLEERQEIWKDDFFEYSLIAQLLYDGENIFQLIKNIQSEEWWNSIERNEITSSITISEDIATYLKKQWPEIVEDSYYLFGQLRSEKAKSKNYVRDVISEFFKRRKNKLEILLAIAIPRIFYRETDRAIEDMITDRERYIIDGDLDMILTDIKEAYEIREIYPLFLYDLFTLLLSGKIIGKSTYQEEKQDSSEPGF